MKIIPKIFNKKFHADTQSYAAFCACRAAALLQKNRSAWGVGELGIDHPLSVPKGSGSRYF